jgi:hypothetical protein
MWYIIRTFVKTTMYPPPSTTIKKVTGKKRGTPQSVLCRLKWEIPGEPVRTS